MSASRRRAGAIPIALAGWLAAGSVAAAQDLPEPEADPGAVREEAERILSGRQFQPEDPNLLERVQEWIGDRLDDLFARLTGSGGATLIAWLLLLGAIALVGFLIWRAMRSTSPRGPERTGPVVTLETHRSLDELRAEAERCEAAGDWKQALLARYRILVGELVERGRIEDIAGRTSGEYRVEVARASPSDARSFDEATGLFEAAWYGDHRTGETENARFRALTGEILGAVPT